MRAHPENYVDSYFRWNIGHGNPPNEIREEKIEAVIHAASNKSIDDDELELSYTNLVGTQRIISLCREHRCKTAILISGIPVLGVKRQGFLKEDDSYDPHTMYHATKAAQELMFRQLYKDGIRTVILRIPSPISPCMSN